MAKESSRLPKMKNRMFSSICKFRSLILAGLALGGLTTLAAPTDDVYLLGPDSAPHPGVPLGKVIGPEVLPSHVYPNTTRNYWIYVPAQYDASKPACLMVFQDGHAFVNLSGDYRIPYVFDNLIYRREMPVTIAVFINPGHLPNQQESSAAEWGDRVNNRRIEYNALDDKYSKLIVDELLPVIRQRFNISADPNDHAIGGASSGAICAFTVAWQRPDQFRKVISTIGSFTDIMGGHVYPELIRNSEPKPIRIFLQDGLNDNRGRRRGPNSAYDPKWDWHAQNIKMVEALTARRYEVNYTWGIGTHSNKQGGAIMPEMLRWLWRDYPRVDDPLDDTERTLLPAATNAVTSLDLPPGPAPTTDRVGFPTEYQRQFHVLRTVDKPKEKKMVTVYGNEQAAGISNLTQLPYPYSAVLVMETAERTKPAGESEAEKSSAKGKVLGLHVMRKGKSFGTAYLSNQAGDWEFAEYKPDGSYLTPPTRSSTCAECHQKAGGSKDFVYHGRFD